MIKMAVSSPPMCKNGNAFIVGVMAETVAAVNLLTTGRFGFLCKDDVCVCVCPGHRLKGWCVVKPAIPIANSCPL